MSLVCMLGFMCVWKGCVKRACSGSIVFIVLMSLKLTWRWETNYVLKGGLVVVPHNVVCGWMSDYLMTCNYLAL